VREDEIAAEAMGVNTTRYKVRAFVIAAFFAGTAGGLFAHTNGVQLNPGELGFMKSFDIIIMVVLGGLGSISGAAIAAAILSILPELLREPPSVGPWGIGIGVVVALASAPFVRRRWMPAVIVVLALAGWELLRTAAQAAGITLSDYRMVLYALALIIMMIARPQGLLGLGEVWNLRAVRRTKGGSR
jgi:branched-chain amino acid transport system permease protein